MANRKKKAIDFIGPSVQDLGLTLEDERLVVEDQKERGEAPPVSAQEKGVEATRETMTALSEPSAVEKVEESVSDEGEAIITQAINSPVEGDKASVNSPGSRRENLYRRAIRDYLNRTLGDKDEVEFKISKMQEELDITMMTLYRHLRYLRDNEFIIKPLRYSSLLKRRK